MIKLLFLLSATGLVACTTTVEYSPGVLVEGCKAKVACKTEPGTAASWTWKFDSTTYKSETKQEFETDELVVATHNGKGFECVATLNPAGNGPETSAANLMKVVANSDKSAKPKVVLPKTITAGASTKLVCESPAACGAEMTYLWYKGDAKVQDQQGADVVTKELTITAPAAGKSEKYKCKSVAKSVENESAQVDVPPSSFGTKAAYSMMVLVLATFTGFLIKM